MKFICPVLSVKNINKSKEFYQKALGQKITLDLGANVTFEGGFALQEDYAALVGINPEIILEKPNNFELYFEVEDLEPIIQNLREEHKVTFLHESKEYPWGQSVIRFYDPDCHIIEIGESMDSVVVRFLKQGMDVDEVSKRTMFPLEVVKHIWEQVKNL